MVMPTTSPPRNQAATRTVELETAIREYGEKIFGLMDAAEPPSLFSRKGFYGALMEWAMRDEHFKTQLFRFVDVLPMLKSSAEVSRHLKEYLGDEQVELSPTLRLGLKAAGGASWLFGAGVKSQVTGMARQFMLGDDPKEIAATLRKHHDQGIAFTVDILGEAVVSEAEADQYAGRYLALMDQLSIAMAKSRAGEAAATVAGMAHQVHGAIGFTFEHTLHHFTRRLYAWRDEFGTEAHWSGWLGARFIAGGDKAFWPTVTAAARLGAIEHV